LILKRLDCSTELLWIGVEMDAVLDWWEELKAASWLRTLGI
jgi:hypothetical protein